MSVFTAIAIYFVIWWITLFAVLPFGVRSQQEEGDFTPGTDPGAPVIPDVKRKFIWTTIVATLIFAAFDVVYTYRLVTVGQVGALFGIH
jgi:predicted secreted protein